MSDIDALLFSDNTLLTPSKISLAQEANNAVSSSRTCSNGDDDNLLVDINDDDLNNDLNLDDVIEVPTSIDEEFWYVSSNFLPLSIEKVELKSPMFSLKGFVVQNP
jgi:hypothetical protein